jgi:hypothetical protein
LKIWVRGGQKGTEPEISAPKTDPDYHLQLGMSNGNFQNRTESVEECITVLVGEDQSRIDYLYDDMPISDSVTTMQRLDTKTGEFVSSAYSIQDYRAELGNLILRNGE